MKLTKELKERIDKYFEQISADELYKILTKKYHMPKISKKLIFTGPIKTWMYNGTKYGAFKTDWDEFGKTKNYDLLVNPITVYNPDWDKCYYLKMLGYHGHGNKLKAFIRDIYDASKHYWVEARKLEIVRKLN